MFNNNPALEAFTDPVNGTYYYLAYIKERRVVNVIGVADPTTIKTAKAQSVYTTTSSRPPNIFGGPGMTVFENKLYLAFVIRISGSSPSTSIYKLNILSLAANNAAWTTETVSSSLNLRNFSDQSNLTLSGKIGGGFFFSYGGTPEGTIYFGDTTGDSTPNGIIPLGS